MTTVYIITHSQRGEEEAGFLGVYSTRELADRVLASVASDNPDFDYTPGEDEFSTEEDWYSICETELIEA